MSVMPETLSQSEIDDLLAKIDEELLKKKIIEMKPKEIEQEVDINERENLRKRYNDIKDVYIMPLERLLIYHYKQMNQSNYGIDLSELSIGESIGTLKRQLLKVGYHPNQLVDFVPRTVEEVNTILKAKQNGFSDNVLSSNEIRLINAREYISKTNESKGPKL